VSTEVIPPPRSEQEMEALVAHEAQARIKKTMHLVRIAWARLAEELFKFSEQEMWRSLGYDSYEAWLADPEIDIERRWAFQLTAIWRELVIHRGADPRRLERAAPSKLQEILPAVRRNHVSLEEGLADAEQLSRSDLRERYGPRGGGSKASTEGARPDTSTRYDAESEPSMAICPTCGSRVREEKLRGH
jgi:hypothetical protein